MASIKTWIKIQSTPKLMKAAILIFFLLANFLNLKTGWADNGDFDRLMRWYTSGPSQIENWPPAGSEMWKQRFFSYWVPDWKLDFPLDARTISSSLLVWAPGVFINRFFYSPTTLSLPILSLGARLLLFLFLWLVFQWIDHRSAAPAVFYAALAFPLALLFSTADVAAFYNSFYQENGLIVFVPLVLSAVAWGQIRQRDWKFYLAYFLCILLAATSKSSLFYLPVLTLPFVLSLTQLRAKPAVFIPLAALLTVVPVFSGLILTHVPTDAPNREYNSLFTGVLMLSRDPQSRLNELGMPGAIACVGADHYSTETGDQCLNTYAQQISYQAVVRTMIAEPAIVLRQLNRMAQIFQNYSLALGRYAFDDPTIRRENRLNLWSVIKQRYFPRGWLLIPMLLVFCLGTAFGWRHKNLAGDLSRVALLCLLAVPIDAMVQILGDGQRDLLKHLFAANMFFDFALIANVNIGIALFIHSRSPRFTHANAKTGDLSEIYKNRPISP